MNDQASRIIRSKVIGILIRTQREKTGREIEDCARELGMEPSEYRAYEFGTRSPSLPELEILSQYLNIPIQVLYKEENLNKTMETESIAERLLNRQNQIAESIKLLIEEKEIDLDELANKLDIRSERLADYENSEIPIPLIELEEIAEELGIEVGELLRSDGYEIAGFTESDSGPSLLPVELVDLTDSVEDIELIKSLLTLKKIEPKHLKTIADVFKRMADTDLTS